MANTSKDLTNITVGYITAVRPTGKSNKYGRIWLARCKCGVEFEIEAATFSKKPKRATGIPKSCGCYQKCNRSHLYKGVGDLSSTRWLNMQKSAKRKGLSFEITIEYAWELFLQQSKLCALSGVLLTMNPTSQARGASTASLDRINSSFGYVIGNVQWVHKVVNDLKSNMPQDDFIIWCRLIAQNSGPKREHAKSRLSLAHLHDVSRSSY